MYRGPIVDAHTHLMLDAQILLGTKPHAPKDYSAVTAGLDIRHVAALVMAPAGDLPHTRALNDLVLGVQERTAGLFYPLCSVHPADGEAALTELTRVAGAGAKGHQLHPNTQSFDVADPLVARVVGCAAQHRLPVLFDAYSPFDPAQGGKFVTLAMEVPDAKLVLAHALGPRFPELMVFEILARYPWWRRNVWIDISATANLLSGGPFAEQFVWVCRKVGVDRVVFGSDYPLDHPAEAVAGVARMGFTADELEAIFYGNAVRLWSLSGSD